MSATRPLPEPSRRSSGPHLVEVSSDDLRRARHLPDAFRSLHRRHLTPSTVVAALVDTYWGGHSAAARRELTDTLVVLLSPLAHPGQPVADDLRDLTEFVVVLWLRRHGGSARVSTPAS